MKIHRSPTFGRQAGFNLIEFLVVLGLAGLLLVFVVPRISSGFSGTEQQAEATAVVEALTATRNLKGSAGYGAAGTNLVPQLIAGNDLPGVWPVSGGVPTNTWGGTVTITSQGSTRRITSALIPPEACIEIAPRVSRGSSVNTTTIGTNTAIVGEVTSAVATTQCGSAPVTITWNTTN